MKVEIWSDVACPFCYIGKHYFEQALKSLPSDIIVDVEWKSFELDPYAKRDYEDDLYSLLANKYGQTREWAINSASSMKEKGRELGLEFNFDDVISTNTFNAHRLIHLAKSKGLQHEAEEVLFEAYFRDGRHIGNPDTLVEIGQEFGVHKSDVEEMLHTDLFANEVREDEQISQQYGIKGVPFFVINRKYGISGAQPISHFVDVLNKVQKEESVINIDEKPENTCDSNSCE